MAVQLLSVFASTSYEEISRLDAELQALATQAFAYMAPSSISTPYSAIPETIRDAVRVALGAGLFPDLPYASAVDNNGRLSQITSQEAKASRDQRDDSETDDVPLGKRQKLSTRFCAAPNPKDGQQQHQRKPVGACLVDAAEQLRLSQASIDGLLRQVSELVPELAPGGVQLTPVKRAGTPASATPCPAAASPKPCGAANSTMHPPNAAASSKPAPLPSTAGAPGSSSQHPSCTGCDHVAPAAVYQIQVPDQQQPRPQGEQGPKDGKPPGQQVAPGVKKRAPLWLHQMLPNRDRAGTAAQRPPDKRWTKKGPQMEAAAQRTATSAPAEPLAPATGRPPPPATFGPSSTQDAAAAAVVQQLPPSVQRASSSQALREGPLQPPTDVQPNADQLGQKEAFAHPGAGQVPGEVHDYGVSGPQPPPSSTKQPPQSLDAPCAGAPPSAVPSSSTSTAGVALPLGEPAVGALVQGTGSPAATLHAVPAGFQARGAAEATVQGAAASASDGVCPEAGTAAIPPCRAPGSVPAAPSPQLAPEQLPPVQPLGLHAAGGDTKEVPVPIATGFNSRQQPNQQRKLPKSLAPRQAAAAQGLGIAQPSKKRGRQQAAAQADTAAVAEVGMGAEAAQKTYASGRGQDTQLHPGNQDQQAQLQPKQQQQQRPLPSQQQGATGGIDAQGQAQDWKKRRRKGQDRQEGLPEPVPGKQAPAPGSSPRKPQPAPGACRRTEGAPEQLGASASGNRPDPPLPGINGSGSGRPGVPPCSLQGLRSPERHPAPEAAPPAQPGPSDTKGRLGEADCPPSSRAAVDAPLPGQNRLLGRDQQPENTAADGNVRVSASWTSSLLSGLHLADTIPGQGAAGAGAAAAATAPCKAGADGQGAAGVDAAPAKDSEAARSLPPPPPPQLQQPEEQPGGCHDTDATEEAAGPAVLGRSDSDDGLEDMPLAARLPKKAKGSQLPPPVSVLGHGSGDADAVGTAAAVTTERAFHVEPSVTAQALPQAPAAASGHDGADARVSPDALPPPRPTSAAADTCIARDAPAANSRRASEHSCDLPPAYTAGAPDAGPVVSGQSLSSLEPVAPANPPAAMPCANQGSSRTAAACPREVVRGQEAAAAAEPAPRAPHSVPSDDEFSQRQRQGSGPLSDAAHAVPGTSATAAATELEVAAGVAVGSAEAAPAVVLPSRVAESMLGVEAHSAEAPMGPAQPSPCASTCEAPGPAARSMPMHVQAPAGHQQKPQHQQASSVGAAAGPSRSRPDAAAPKPPLRATSMEGGPARTVMPTAGGMHAGACRAAAPLPGAKQERKYKPTAPPRRPAVTRVAAPSTHAELAAAAAAFMAALRSGGDGGAAEAAAAAAATTAAAATAAAGPASSTGACASEPLGPASGSDFAEWAPARPPPADTATSPVRPPCSGQAGPEGEQSERELGAARGPTRPQRAGSQRRQSSQGCMPAGDSARSEGTGGISPGGRGSGGGGGSPAGGRDGAAGSRENSSGGTGGDGDGSAAGGGARREGVRGEKERSLTPDAEEGVALSEVEREEWRRRRLEIERQRAEAAAEREAARRARATQRATSASVVGSLASASVAANAELQRRIRQRLAEHHQLASAAAKEAAAKEEVRCRIRASLQERYRKVLDDRDLARFLKQLGVLPKGGSLKTAEQRAKALKVAKIRFHPDKASGSLEARVYAEEVSKLLNSWDWT